MTIQKLTLSSAGVYSGTQVTQLHSADFNINAYNGVVNVTSGAVNNALLVNGSPVITQARGTATSAAALNVVSGNEIRFGPTKLSSAGVLYVGYKWSDGSTSPTITAYRMCNAAGALTEVICSKITASTLNVRTVLYNNTTGTNGTVTLSATAANYNHMRIYYRLDEYTETLVSSVDVYSPNGKTTSLFVVRAAAGAFVQAWATISGTSITKKNTYVMQSNPFGANTGNRLYIVRVEAWNE